MRTLPRFMVARRQRRSFLSSAGQRQMQREHVDDRQQFPEQLHRYCDEFSFRWDHRSITDSQRTEIAIPQAEGKRRSYRQP
jgi:hypothetical protein